MRKILISFLLFLSIASISAQENYTVFGIKLAVGGSKMYGINEYAKNNVIPGSSLTTLNSYSPSVYAAWDLGFVLQVMRNKLMIQTELIYSYTNTKLNNAYVNKTDRLKRIRVYNDNLVVNFGTKIRINDDFRFVAGLGPYIGFNIEHWFSAPSNLYGIHSGASSPPFEGVLDAEEADYKDFDFGGSLLAGIEYQNMQFAINYYHGLTSIVKDIHPLYNRSLKLSVTYFF